MTGSRHSSSGSRRAESHSNVEAVILKQSLKESGFLGMAEWAPTNRRPSLVRWLISSAVTPGSGDWDRFRLCDRRERVAAVFEKDSRWVMSGERELDGEENESPEGGEMTKRRRRSSDIREESRATRALLSIFSLQLAAYFVKKWGIFEEIKED